MHSIDDASVSEGDGMSLWAFEPTPELLSQFFLRPCQLPRRLGGPTIKAQKGDPPPFRIMVR